MPQFGIIALHTDREWRGQIGGGGIDPVGDGLRIDPQMPGDAPQVSTVHIELQGLAAQIESVAVVFRLGCIGAPAVSAFAAQVPVAFLLARCCLVVSPQVGQDKIGSAIGYYSPKILAE